MRFQQIGSTLATVAVATATAALAKVPAVLTPQDMLAAPRPQPAIASPDGSHAISVVDRWNPKEDKTTRSVYLLSLNTTVTTSPIQLFTSPPGQASEFLWLNTDNIAYLNDTSLYSFSINYSTKADKQIDKKRILDFPVGVNPTDLHYQADTELLAFSGQVWQDGDFERVSKLDNEYAHRGTTGVVFDDLFIRHWDTWRTPGKVWTIGLTKLEKHNLHGFQSTLLHGQKFLNILNSTGLRSQMDPVGSLSLSSTHLAFSIKAPHLNVATHTREDVYLLPLPSTPLSSSSSHLTPSAHGAISGVTFSPDGKRLAWLEMNEDGYESDKRVVVVHELAEKGLGKTERWTDEWDRSPTGLTWSIDSESLYFTAEHNGDVIPYHLTHRNHLPTPLFFKHATSSITPLTNTSILLSISSLTSPADSFVLDLSSKQVHDVEGDGDGDKLPHHPLHRLTNWSEKYLDGRLDGLAGEKFWFKGADDWDVMGWAIKPRGWSETDAEKGKKYPLAFLVHGGPQGSWEDAWNVRWNPALFASNGYFVVSVNPTGSTGYGQEFCDRIKGEWGGRPFKDLLAGYKHALEVYPEIDSERTAMLGASYGGYMANWIQGHNDQFGFKAIVCHDGIFDTTDAFYTTEEVWFPQREFGGSPTQTRQLYEKWNPMNHVGEWRTPELVIHGGRDYRLLEGQGISAFTALQVQGVPSRFLYFPDENHWVLKPSNSLKWHHEVFRWLEEWTGEKSTEGKAENEGHELLAEHSVEPQFLIQT